jgi:hypothetical protein
MDHTSLKFVLAKVEEGLAIRPSAHVHHVPSSHILPSPALPAWSLEALNLR